MTSSPAESSPAATKTAPGSAQPDKPRVWTVYGAFALALLLTSALTVTLITASFARAHPGVVPSRAQLMEHALVPSTFSLTILLSAVVLSGVSLLAAAFSRERLVERLSLGKARGRVLPAIVAMVGLVALSVVIENITILLGVEIGGTLELIARSIGAAQGLQSVIVVLLISLGPGIGEELLFRGYIQTRLLARYRPFSAIVVTSLLFGIMHMDPLQSTLTVFLGVYLGFVAYRFGSVWPAVGAHALNNGVSAVALTFLPDEPASPEPSLFGLALGLIVFFACVRYVSGAVPDPASDASIS